MQPNIKHHTLKIIQVYGASNGSKPILVVAAGRNVAIRPTTSVFKIKIAASYCSVCFDRSLNLLQLAL
jgi:hypothetical protein